MNNKKDIRYLFLDVDGTLTDGKIYMGQNGEMMKAFDIKDGLGIHDILPRLGIIPVIITGRKSQIVENRCKELGIEHLFQGVQNKKEKMLSFLAENDCKLENAAFMGDDLNDLECVTIVHENGGCAVCPADAAKQVLEVADYVCQHRGGEGAVRDFIDNCLWDSII